MIAGVAFSASGLLPSGKDGPSNSSSDIPDSYVGTWSGPVQRDGEPTGQYRRLMVSRGKVGEVVANSFSLGTDYECKSDAKLVSAGKSLELDTKVVKSVPRKCSALGSHKLTAGPSSTLTLGGRGPHRDAERVQQPEKLPEEYVGTWQRQFPTGARSGSPSNSCGRAARGGHGLRSHPALRG